MAPLKALAVRKTTAVTNSENVTVKTMTTRSSKLSIPSIRKDNVKDSGLLPKRKAASPIKGKTLKRSALGNITNAIETKCVINSGKKPVKEPTVTKPTIASRGKVSHTVTSAKLSTSKSPKPPVQTLPIESLLPPLPKSRLKPPILLPTNPKQIVNEADSLRIASTSEKPTAVVTGLVKSVKSPAVAKKPTNVTAPATKARVTVKPKGMVNHIPKTRRSSGRRSTLDNSENSLYVSALSDVLDDVTPNQVTESLPEPLINIDEEYANDPYQCAVYAHEIFEYLKTREDHFKINDYMDKQPVVTAHMRAILVDWMVEIQENFELNHETLYLGVKMVDTFLSKIKVTKTNLQLVGATAMLIAAKYDERIPPSVDDFLYICNEAYVKTEFFAMETSILKVIDFQLGFPLSYRFLRRYARCAKVAMPLLTLARFILEHTLMDYKIVTLSDSKIAAAALYLAFKMKKEQEWDDTLIHFTGYRVKDFIEVVHILNNSLHQKPRQSLSTVRNKYSHEIFYGVAKIPLVSSEDL